MPVINIWNEKLIKTIFHPNIALKVTIVLLTDALGYWLTNSKI